MADARSLFSSLLVFGLGVAQCHYALLRGWPLIFGSGAVLVLVGLIATVMGCIALFAKAFADAWERER